MKYLMVEDDPGDVSLLGARLKMQGYDVTVLLPGEALQWNEEQKPDVVQLDGLGGECFGLLGELKAANNGARYFIYSADRDVADEARRRRVRFFYKGSELMELLKLAESIIAGAGRGPAQG